MSSIYVLAVSVNCHGAQLVIEENKQWFSDYKTVYMDFLAGDTNKPEFLAVNPWGTTPTIVEGDLNLWESTAILRYLCNSRKPNLEKWYPSDPKKRAKIDQFLDLRQSSYIEAQNAHCYPLLLGTPTKAHSKQTLMELLKDIAAVYLKDGKFLCGFDHPTIADASFACSFPHIAVHRDFELPAPIVAYQERFAKACPSWAKIRAPVDGFIASIHAKQAEAKSVDHGTLYVVYGTRSSKVMWLVHTLKAPLKLKTIAFDKGEHQSPEYLKKNPNGGVPTLELPDGQCLFESSAIVSYLLEKYDPSNSLTGPVGSKARNQFLVWNAFSNEIEDIVGPYFLNTVVFGDQGDKELAKSKKAAWDGHYKAIIERFLTNAGAGNYANGTSNFSALDIVMGFFCNVASMGGLTKGSAVLEAYVAKVQQHPCFAPAHREA